MTKCCTEAHDDSLRFLETVLAGARSTLPSRIHWHQMPRPFVMLRSHILIKALTMTCIGFIAPVVLLLPVEYVATEFGSRPDCKLCWRDTYHHASVAPYCFWLAPLPLQLDVGS